MIADCKKIQATPQGKGLNCYAGQFEKYEGLTVNAAEAINSAGGVVTDDYGKPNVNTPEAKGPRLPGDGFKQGYIPKEAHHLQGGGGPRRAFQEGKLIFLRNWPYVYSLADGDEGTPRSRASSRSPRCPASTAPASPASAVTTLGISTYAKHKKTALDFIKFYTSEERQNDEPAAGLAGSGVDFDLRRHGAAEASSRTSPPSGSINSAQAAPEGGPLRRRHHGHPGRGLRRDARAR